MRTRYTYCELFLYERNILIMKFLKMFLILLHFFIAIFLSIIIFISPRSYQRKIIQLWSIVFLIILNIKLTTNLNLSLLYNKNNYLVVCNHISWLDIIVLNSLYPISFVAKDDIKNWPIINILAIASNTIFINRTSITAVKQITANVEKMLSLTSVCIFPEGTSTNGTIVLPFKSNLFQAAVDSKKNVLPIAIKYRKDNFPSLAPAYYGDVSLMQSILSVVGESCINAELTILPHINNSSDRKILSKKSFDAIQMIILQ
jgi:1-acyl-sn-glycerol-3-phosphate acyltransferase